MQKPLNAIFTHMEILSTMGNRLIQVNEGAFIFLQYPLYPYQIRAESFYFCAKTAMFSKVLVQKQLHPVSAL